MQELNDLHLKHFLLTITGLIFFSPSFSEQLTVYLYRKHYANLYCTLTFFSPQCMLQWAITDDMCSPLEQLMHSLQL